MPVGSVTDRARITEDDFGIPPLTLFSRPADTCSLVVVHATDPHQLCKRFVLLPEEPEYRVGRAAECQILLDGPSVSRVHTTIERRESDWWVCDAGSTNGTWVNDARVEAHRLEHGDRVKVGHVVLKYLSRHAPDEAFVDAVREAMVTDGLTQTYTHAAFRDALTREFGRAQRYRRPLSLLMMDLDHFKTVNDTHGHLAGDYVLRAVAAVVRGRIRTNEVLGRLGGEEFAILLPETGLEGALTLAKDLQRRIASRDYAFDGRSLEVTASFGLASLTDEMTGPESLLAAADRLLYRAKGAGRNRIVIDE